MERGKPFSATESPLVDFDAVCQKVRAAVEPARAHAISLHDERGDLLWLSESSMGPDEHNAVRDAIESFSSSTAAPVLAYDLGDARSAVLMRALNARRAMVGVVMVIMDTRVISQDDRGAVKLLTPKLQRALSDFAGMRPDLEPKQEPVAAAPSPIAVKTGLTSIKGAPKGDPARKPPAAAKPPNSSPSNRAAPNGAAQTRPAQIPPTPSQSAQNRPAPPKSAPARAAVAPPSASITLQNSAPMELSLADSARIPAARPARATPAESSQHAANSGAAPTSGHAPGTGRAPGSGSAPSPPRTPNPQPAPGAAEATDKRAPPVPPEIDRLHAALRRSPIALHVQRLVPLTKGSQLKRYEVLLRSKGDDAPNAAPQAMLKAAVDNGLGSMIDRRVITELVGWLVHHPDVWQSSAVMFSVNLTTTALHDEHFIKFVGLCLAKSSLPKSMIAFEVDVPTAIKLPNKLAEVAAALHRLGCPLVLDDFALRTECFDLLRLPGVRYVKLAPEITAKMRTDKISQAAITAVVQMARVLGMHTVAKRTETAAEQEWLTALGVDFIQSHAMSPPISIESLSRAQKTRP
jgi:EAL domain-containing protein (putative c-di-GMP-specific phosphodiesterase class I)